MDIILKYFPELDPSRKQRLSSLFDLYNEWNKQINVISRKDIDQLYLHHVLYSMAIAKIVSFRNGSKVLDAGTGGGFPGIPLAILFPETKFHLVDSIGKKIKVVSPLLVGILRRVIMVSKHKSQAAMMEDDPPAPVLQ